jgi:hypothetical protein
MPSSMTKDISGRCADPDQVLDQKWEKLKFLLIWLAVGQDRYFFNIQAFGAVTICTRIITVIECGQKEPWDSVRH